MGRPFMVGFRVVIKSELFLEEPPFKGKKSSRRFKQLRWDKLVGSCVQEGGKMLG